MKHTLKPSFLTGPIQVDVVGAGGNGSQFVSGLARMHASLKALGHPHGFDVIVHDPDVVTAANAGRQLFSPSDIGQPKAAVTVNRINAFYGTAWRSNISAFGGPHGVAWDYTNHHKIVVGCVDTRASRKSIGRLCRNYDYWLDLGNDAKIGQVVLGQPRGGGSNRLPCITELFPSILRRGKEDNTPSCSLAGALVRQDLFINQTVATWALNLLWSLFRNGGLDHHGYFVNLESGHTAPIEADPNVWQRFGYFARGNSPLRKIVRFIKRAKSNHWGARHRVLLSCGHTVSCCGEKRAHCEQCRREELVKKQGRTLVETLVGTQ